MDIPDYEDVDIEIKTASKFQLNFASIVFPFSVGEKNVVGGISYRRIYDFTQKTTVTLTGTYDELSYEDDYTGGINAITPAIGVQINESISAGAALNILTGEQDYQVYY